MVIKSFKCRETERLYRRENSKKFPGSIQKLALRKLWMLDAAETLEDLQSPPGNRLESLKGDRQGQSSLRINNQFRLCFSWRENNAHDVEIVDYH
jgi:proteic killer suppression protein